MTENDLIAKLTSGALVIAAQDGLTVTLAEKRTRGEEVAEAMVQKLTPTRIALASYGRTFANYHFDVSQGADAVAGWIHKCVAAAIDAERADAARLAAEQMRERAAKEMERRMMPDNGTLAAAIRALPTEGK